MADETLEIKIRSSGGDQVAAQFRTISTGAQQMGVATEQAATRSSTGLKTMSSGADTLNKSMAALGAVSGIAAGFLADSARAAEESAQVQRQLEQAIANTGDSYDQYADQIEAVSEAATQLGIDDEAAAQAIQALTEITGSASVALDNMGLVMDLAAAKGIDLVTAAELVGKVHEGNTGILARYGIVVAENATAEEALAQVQQQVAGQAEAHATTLDRVRVQYDNLQESVGGAIGGLAPFVSLLPGLSVGLTAASSAAGALGIGLGPIGLAAAAVAAGVAIYQLTKNSDDLASAMEDAQAAGESLQTVIDQLVASDAEGASGARTMAATLNFWSDEMPAAVREAEAAIKDIDALYDDIGGRSVMPPETLAEIARLEAVIRDATAATKIADPALTALQGILLHTGEGADEARAQLDELFRTFSTGEIAEGGVEDDFLALEEGIIALNGNLINLDEQANQAGRAIDENLLTAIKRVTDAMRADVLDPSREGAFGALGRDLETISAAAGSAGDIARTSAVALGDALASETITLTAYIDRIAGIAEPFEEAAEFAARFAGSSAELTAEVAAFREEAAAAAAIADDFAAGVQLMSDASLTAADVQQALNASLREGESAMDRMARGSTSAGVALRAFKDIQDGIIASQDPFNQQQSEYSTQLGYITDAVDLLNERRAAGIALSAEEEDFLNRAGAAQERLQGGVEDATLALGEQALTYGENMSKGDQLNQTLSGVSGAVGTLTNAVLALTAALQGVPPDTSVLLTVGGNWPGAASQIAALGDELRAIDGLSATTTLTNTTRNVVIGPTQGGLHGGAFAHGGLVTAELAEAGPELVSFANGGLALAMQHGVYALPTPAFVTPAPETHHQLRGLGSTTINLHFHGDINGIGGLDEVFAEAERLLRARLAGLGML